MRCTLGASLWSAFLLLSFIPHFCLFSCVSSPAQIKEKHREEGKGFKGSRIYLCLANIDNFMLGGSNQICHLWGLLIRDVAVRKGVEADSV